MKKGWIVFGSVVAIAVGLLALDETLSGTPSHFDLILSAIRRSPSSLSRQGAVIATALNKHYQEEGEYPPYLLGGSPGEEWHEAGLVDPLLQGRFLKEYPRSSLYEPYRAGTLTKFVVSVDPRGLRQVRNVVSSPDDPIVLYMRDFFMPFVEALLILRAEEGNPPDEWSKNLDPRWNPDVLLETLSSPRYYCAGAVRRRGGGEGRPASLRIIALKHPLPSVLTHFAGQVPWLDSCGGQFGYQRGDTIEALEGGTPQEAWLWFYGFGDTYGDAYAEKAEDLPGLDLVDNANGLIQPDGIPDGIVLLYKLKEGKVVEVVKKYD